MKHPGRRSLLAAEFVGEFELGPRRQIVFDSRPIVPPRTTVEIKWGDVVLVIRVRDRVDLRSIGEILEMRGLPSAPATTSTPQIDAGCLIEAGLASLAARDR